MGKRNMPAMCCDRFNRAVSGMEAFDIDRHRHEIDIPANDPDYTLYDIKYCPFCGKEIRWE